MRKLYSLVLLAASIGLPLEVKAQISDIQIIYTATDPTGPCGYAIEYINKTTGVTTGCVNGAFANIGGGPTGPAGPTGPTGPAGAGNSTICMDATGSTTTYTCPTPTPAVTTLSGLSISFIPQTTNTGTSTVNVNALGAKTLKLADGSTNIPSNALVGGQTYSFFYDGTNFRQGTVSAANVPILNQNTTGTAAALGATPTPCSTGQAPTGVLANGNSTGCATLTPAIASVTVTDLTTLCAATAALTNGGIVSIGPITTGTFSNCVISNPNITWVCIGPSNSTRLNRTLLSTTLIVYVLANGFSTSGCTLASNSIFDNAIYTVNGAGLTWGSGTSYSINQYVVSSGAYYISLTNSNIGNTPVSSPSSWSPVVSGLMQLGGSGFSNFSITNTTFIGNTGDAVLAMYDVSNVRMSGLTVTNGGIYGANNLSNIRLSDSNISNYPNALGTSAVAFHATTGGDTIDSVVLTGNAISCQGTFCFEGGSFGGAGFTHFVYNGGTMTMTGNGAGCLSIDTATSPILKNVECNAASFTAAIGGVELKRVTNPVVSNVSMNGAPYVINETTGGYHSGIYVSGVMPCMYLLASDSSNNHADDNIVDGAICSGTGGNTFIVAQTNNSTATVSRNTLRNIKCFGTGSEQYCVYWEFNNGTMTGNKTENIYATAISQAGILLTGASTNNLIGLNTFGTVGYAYQRDTNTAFTFTQYNSNNVPGLAVIGGGTPALSISSGTMGSTSTDVSGSITSTTTGAYTPTITFAGLAPNSWQCTMNNITNPSNVILQTSSSTTQAVFSGVTNSSDIIYYSCGAH